MSPAPALLAVPNISEGRDTDLVRHIAGTACVLDIHSDPDHHRSVITYGGDAGALIDAVADMVERAVTSLDIRTHEGVHPRNGVVDVLPIVPYAATDDDARHVLTELSWRIAQGPGVTLFPYGRAADDGRTLPQLRRSLRTHPDPQHPSAGVICAGIRDVLVAFNVNLDIDLAVALHIAAEIRTSRRQTLAFALPSRELVQVSMNLVDPFGSGPADAFGAVADHTTAIADAELVGLAPELLLGQFAGLPMMRTPRSIEAAARG